MRVGRVDPQLLIVTGGIFPEGTGKINDVRWITQVRESTMDVLERVIL